MFKLKKRSRIDYWSCSKFADWIRGTDKPFALEWGEWDTWHEKAKKKHPFRYWVADELFDYLQNFVNLPLDVYHTIQVYIRNKYIDKIHYLKTDLIPGEYYDLDHRILHALFTELTNLIEIDYATRSKYISRKDKKYKFKNGRCTEAGLDYIYWQISLVYNEDYGITPDDKLYNEPTEQAIVALKVLQLYNWWNNRNNRPDPYDIFTDKTQESYRLISLKEEEYYQEDTNMLIELIKIRQHLWT